MGTLANMPIEQMTLSPNPHLPQPPSATPISISVPTTPLPSTHITTTIYSFPTLEPLRYAYYPHNHLYLPLRRDLLHRAVIYEGDKTRSGTAHTKWRDDVHGSHKKLYPQKGTGRARVGDKQSPVRRGGGVAFGPKARDFSTKLPRKIYDLAWRTALSYRYRRGELVVVDRLQNQRSNATWWLKQIFEGNGWGNASGRSLLVSRWRGKSNNALYLGMERVGEDGRMLEVSDVDVKDLLGMGRIVIEQKALNAMLKEHVSDLVPGIGAAAGQLSTSASSAVMEEMLEDGELLDAAEMEELVGEEAVDGLIRDDVKPTSA